MFYTSQYDQQIAGELSEGDRIDFPHSLNDPHASHNENDPPKRLSRSTTVKPNKQLPEKAIRLMNAWFLTHEDNPYPNRNDLDYLATTGGIKESQVKAWFSNKRNRTQNTHPKRAKRYMIRSQTPQNPALFHEPEKINIADELEQRAQAFQHSHEPLSSSSSANTAWPWLPSYSYEYYPHHHQYYNP